MKLIIACPVTDEPVPTGIRIDPVSLAAMPIVKATLERCPACDGRHEWFTNEGWLTAEDYEVMEATAAGRRMRAA